MCWGQPPHPNVSSNTCNIIDCTNFGHQCYENTTIIVYGIVDISKAKYLFARMDLDGVVVDCNTVLKRQKKAGDVNPLERCEVLGSKGMPLKLKFKKSSEVLTL